ncbi:MAG: hypothetical protein V1835_02070 [Candidatus Micrarchaeota archaeon]
MVTSLETLDDWLVVFWIAVPTMFILNMYLGLDYATMLLPFRGWFPGFYGIDAIIGMSLIIILLEKYWFRIGWLVTFAFVFGLIWILG